MVGLVFSGQGILRPVSITGAAVVDIGRVVFKGQFAVECCQTEGYRMI
jgi:hypothetical protein